MIQGSIAFWVHKNKLIQLTYSHFIMLRFIPYRSSNSSKFNQSASWIINAITHYN